MRTAADFDSFYAVPDPWGSRASVRDKSLGRWLPSLVSGQRVLELGCGEGHLTEGLLGSARSVTGVDISRVAIDRAEARNLANAKFERSDFLNVSFEGYDLIVAIECLSYLTPEEQESFFGKVSSEHAGKCLVLSGAIIGENEYGKYFTHQGLLEKFAQYGMSVVYFRNLSVYWRPLSSRIIANLAKVPLGHLALDWLPERLIYQRLYLAIAPK